MDASSDHDSGEGGDLNRAYVVDDDTRDGEEYDGEYEYAGGGGIGGGTATSRRRRHEGQSRLIPPLPLRIFAPDAEVVLPQAYTATQLFGVERQTGIELEAASGTSDLCRLFQRWLALMPLGDHENGIDPPGVTVMRISGGRYRVTGAHRVVWRWMNKFSLPDDDEAAAPPATATATTATTASPAHHPPSSSGEDAASSSADFDFGDLVTMTIIDVFETDSDGRLLSYCPTFDNRAVHKTQEVTERIRKGASLVKERMEVVARSPAGKSVNKATHDLGKLSMSAALAVGNIVKRRIEEERHRRETRGGGGGGGGDGGGGRADAITDAVEEMVDDDVEDDEVDGSDDDGSAPAEV